FVSSDGLAPTQLESRSSFSRGEAFRIGDINQQEVFEYFQKRGVADTIDSSGKSLYLRLFELVGGRFKKLDEAATKIKRGVSFEDLKASLFEDVSKRIPEAFDDAKTARRHIITAANSGQAFTAEDICDKHKDVKSMTVKEVIAKFVAANILSNVGKGYVFHSNLEKSYFRENSK
ncbi:hypothetical protein MP638_005217, partial [Amoeboaphelidium occidentale]